MRTHREQAEQFLEAVKKDSDNIGEIVGGIIQEIMQDMGGRYPMNIHIRHIYAAAFALMSAQVYNTMTDHEKKMTDEIVRLAEVKTMVIKAPIDKDGNPIRGGGKE